MNGAGDQAPLGSGSPAGLAKSRPSRMALYGPLILLAIVCLGWTAFWFFAVEKAKKVAEGFIARESERGREWVCPNQGVSGFPFRVQINCDKPQLLVKATDGFHHEATLGGLVLHARILSSENFIAVFQSPLRAKQGSEGVAELSWQNARASFTAGILGPSEASIEIVAPVLTTGAANDEMKASAKDMTIHMRKSPGETIGTDFVALVQDLAFPPFDQLSGNAAPMRFEMQASAPGLVPVVTRKLVASVEDWRAKGGKARIVVLKAVKGNANIDLSGVLGLDEQHRLEGNLQGRAKGLESLTGRFSQKSGIDLGGLLGRIGGGQGLPVSLTFENGRMRYGPFPLMELSPLY